MKNKDTEYVTVIDEKNEKVNAEVLFTYDANGDNYVFYAIDDNVFAAKISNPEEDTDWKLIPVEEDEWKLLEKVYKEWEAETEEE